MLPPTSSTRIPSRAAEPSAPRSVTWQDLLPEISSGSVTLIDVRSPKEYALGRVPRAVSAPLLTDEERHVVGLTYKTESANAAALVGLELFASKAEAFLATVAAATDEGRRPVAVHCWRGGMRSGFVTRYLRAAGFDAMVVSGGYKAYRHYVLDALEELARKNLVVLDGRTGSGKTDLLRTLPDGFPKLDFERLANHRGSAFGDFAQADSMPTQQNFENELVSAYERFRKSPAILVEIENFFGHLRLPTSLREAVETAPTVLVERDFEDRVERLAAEYAPYWDEAQDVQFTTRLELLSKYTTPEQRQQITAAVKSRDFHTATTLLLKWRYDKAYDKGIKRREKQVLATFNLTHDEDAARQFLFEQCRIRPEILRN